MLSVLFQRNKCHEQNGHTYFETGRNNKNQTKITKTIIIYCISKRPTQWKQGGRKRL